MTRKVFADTETSGVDDKLNAIIEIGCIIEIDGDVIDTFEFRCKPLPGDMVCQAALDVNKTSYETMMSYSPPDKTY